LRTSPENQSATIAPLWGTVDIGAHDPERVGSDRDHFFCCKVPRHGAIPPGDPRTTSRHGLAGCSPAIHRADHTPFEPHLSRACRWTSWGTVSAAAIESTLFDSNTTKGLRGADGLFAWKRHGSWEPAVANPTYRMPQSGIGFAQMAPFSEIPSLARLPTMAVRLKLRRLLLAARRWKSAWTVLRPTQRGVTRPANGCTAGVVEGTMAR
jgi:hypothetical protein